MPSATGFHRASITCSADSARDLDKHADELSSNALEAGQSTSRPHPPGMPGCQERGGVQQADTVVIGEVLQWRGG
eukprot:758968-Hanusia_phi.AAC.4